MVGNSVRKIEAVYNAPKISTIVDMYSADLYAIVYNAQKISTIENENNARENLEKCSYEEKTLVNDIKKVFSH